MSLFDKIFKRKNNLEDTLKDEIVKPSDKKEQNTQTANTVYEPKQFKSFNISTAVSENKEPKILDGLTMSELRKAIQKKGNEIIKTLHLDVPFDESKINIGIPKGSFLYIEPEMYKIYLIFKYLVNNADYDPEIVKDKRQGKEKTLEEVVTKDVYRCLCINKTVCTGDACAMVYLLSKIGIKANHHTISPPENDKYNYHEIVTFTHNEKLKVMDITLTRTALKNGTIKRLSTLDFSYDAKTYFTKIRPNWIIVANYRNIDLDL